MKLHLYFGGRIQCNVNAEAFSAPPEKWLDEHPANRCGRCELSQLGQQLILKQWKSPTQELPK